MSATEHHVGGIGLPSALGLLFIGLKLAHVIGWAWVWVLCPFWFGLAILAAILAFWFGVLMLAALAGGLKRRM